MLEGRKERREGKRDRGGREGEMRKGRTKDGDMDSTLPNEHEILKFLSSPKNETQQKRNIYSRKSNQS